MSGQWETCEACEGTGRTYGISSGGCDECGGFGRWWDEFEPAEHLVDEPLSELRSPEGFPDVLGDPFGSRFRPSDRAASRPAANALQSLSRKDAA